MNTVISIIETARKLREIKQISLKNPISSLTIINNEPKIVNKIDSFLNYIYQ